MNSKNYEVVMTKSKCKLICDKTEIAPEVSIDTEQQTIHTHDNLKVTLLEKAISITDK